jgi:hypothetical protein
MSEQLTPTTIDIILNFVEIAQKAGFDLNSTGVLGISPSTEAANKLSFAASSIVQERLHSYPLNTSVTITLIGPGPIWGYLALTISLSLKPIVRTIHFGLPNNKLVTVYQAKV